MTAKALQEKSISELKALAVSLGYSVTKTKKADIIGEILRQEAEE